MSLQNVVGVVQNLPVCVGSRREEAIEEVEMFLSALAEVNIANLRTRAKKKKEA